MSYSIPFPKPSLELAAHDFTPPPPPLDRMDPELAALATEVLEAASKPELWVGWLRKLLATFDCRMGQIALFDFKRGAALLHCLATQEVMVEPGMVLDWEDLTPVDVRAGFMAAFPGRAITTDDMDPAKLVDIPVVQFAPPEVGKFMMVNLPDDPIWAFVSVLRHRDSERFTAHDRARMASLGVWFDRAMHIFRAIEAARFADTALISTVDTLPAPMGIASPSGRIEMLNAAAYRLLKVNSPADFRLPMGWQRAISQVSQSAPQVLPMPIQGRATTARLTLMPAPRELVLVEFDTDPESSVIRLDLFCAHYGLTQAERRVLEMLLEGETGASAARRLSRSHETVRTQLRSIREKTGLPTQQAVVVAVRNFMSDG
jgi:DNA-binding CsgD family transcriptional regulator